MSSLSQSLLWCALQTTLLAMLTLLLGARPWRVGGSTAPLVGLGVSILVVLDQWFGPVPAGEEWSNFDGRVPFLSSCFFAFQRSIAS